MAVNDPKYRFLRGLGFDADLNTMEQDWLSTLVDNPSYEYNDLWYDYLVGQGYDGALQDMWKRFIRDQGYSDDYDFWEAVANGDIPFPGSDGITVGLDGDFLGYDGNVGDLNPKEFLDTGVDITRIGAIGGGSDWSLNGDWAANGDWLLEEFELFVIGDGLPDVGDIEFTVDGETTVLTYNAGTYESDDLGASRIFELFVQNIGETFPFDIQLAQPSGGLTVGKYDFDFGAGIIEYKGFAPANVIGSPPENPAFGSLSPTNYLGLEIDAFIVGSSPAIGVSIVQFGNTVTGVADLGDINVIVDGVPYLLLYDTQQSNYLNDGAVADALFNAIQDGQTYTFDVQLAP